MTNSNRVYAIAGILLVCGFLLFVAILAPGLVRMLSTPRTATPDVVATFQALLPTLTPPPGPLTPTAALVPDGPTGHIVFTCQIFKYQVSEQVCIVSADGSGYNRLTADNNVRHFYPSLSPDGQSVVYSAFNTQSLHFEIYELNLATAEEKNLTYAFGDLNAPEISPDV